MVERTYRAVDNGSTMVYVATDDKRIVDAVKGFGGNVIMTDSNLCSGTDRVAQAVERIEDTCDKKFDIVVNMQCDEPFTAMSDIQMLVNQFQNKSTSIATLATTTNDAQEQNDVNNVKVVCDSNGFAMYFSRLPIPFLRSEEISDATTITRLKHIGIYAFRRDALKRITLLPQSPLEKIEKLEQLRWLEAGEKISVAITTTHYIGIDTEEDLRKAQLFLDKNNL